ncbi:uncharacterized protein Z520_05434 [Fonsecaea multimorphosa CBS 102226]|uniref:DNA mismatch repair protein S5 domain-containing protein n=1 Tax=Fonsecaea multimorphosa CBS 102226 TaxID=1442371 RepID=A0A0D2KQL4_9EURO|nr:uncharacterized protein Z520_05434 [Fonsecaea multimorphosa CBS 102226]KIX98973.1 hypothetical protein Z520_05434 [Fonsecaea multimorphosa CBS 102226]OAL25244.1 hypothetical protein AYO22_05121 [Fonsecaea multimorphosa]
MPIQALPENTARALGSSLVLTDARSVVKELVDNALDARATAISVEIANNTLDVIQVKDNGTGIGVEDRQLLCKRGCTSKIRSLEDLERLGGSSLGFRGEALASLVELSQAVLVTTRVDGEVVGTTVKYAVSGMLSSSSASHPVGTTIRVQDFLSKIPVRKQTALKESTKTLQAIRKLFFSFAFARPEVRLSFKVLKGKNDKFNWTYAPTLTASVTEVATKIVGKDIVSECTAHSICSDDCDVDLDSGWKFNALLLSATSASANARNAGQYMSIDGRPMNSDRGTMREVAKSYKRHLRKTLSSSESASGSRPFLLLQIQCPAQSYDVNVEPTKDEVLFNRPDQLLSLAECLFNRAYPGLERSAIDVPEDDRAAGSPAIVSTSTQHTSRLGLAEVQEENNSLQHEDPLIAADMEETLTSRSSVRNPFTIAAMNAQVKPGRMDMSQARAMSDADRNTLADREKAVTADDVCATAAASRNPSESPSGAVETSPSPSPRPGPPMRRRVNTTTRVENEEADTQISDDGNSVTMPQRLNLQEWLTPDPLSHLPSGSNVISRNIKGSDPRNKNIGASDTRSRSDIDLSSSSSTSQTRRGWGPGQKLFKVPFKRQDLTAPSGIEPLTPPSTVRSHHQLSLLQDLRDVPAVSEPSEADSEDVHSDQWVQPRRASASLATSPETGPRQQNSELEEIMDFEHRKKAAIAHQRRAMRGLTSASLGGLGRSSQPVSSSASASASVSGESTQSASIEDYGTKFGPSDSRVTIPSSSNPHRNRYLKALQDLLHAHPQPGGELQLESEEQSYTSETHIRDHDLGESELPPDDPRAYLIRQRQGQRSAAANGKIYRTKSSKLPLETIPPGSTTVNLVLTTNALDLKDNSKGVLYRRQVQTLARTDPYITRGQTHYIDFDDCHDASSIDTTWASIL